jgi:hypothetical protein
VTNLISDVTLGRPKAASIISVSFILP